MTLQEFVTKYTGKFVEYHSYDPAAKNQCVDLANQWLDEGLGLQAIIGTNAIDFPGKAVADGMEWIPNSETGVPDPGDLIVYEGTIGHIDIALEGCTQTKVIAFSQNYPTGSPCVVRSSSYLRPKVVGWIHPEGTMLPDEIAVKKTDFERLVSKASAYDEILSKYNVADNQALFNMISGYLARNTDLGNQLGTAQAEVINKTEIIIRRESELLTARTDNSDLLERLNDASLTIEQLGKDKGTLAIQLAQLQVQYDSLKQGQVQGLTKDSTLQQIADFIKNLFWRN